MPFGDSGEVIAVYGPRGGTGRSLLCANLAVAMRQVTGEDVVAVDCNPAWGVLEVIFDLQPARTTASLTPRLGSLDGKAVEGALVRHESSGVRILAGPDEPGSPGELTGQAVEVLLPLLRTHYDWVLLDLSTRLDDLTLAALERSDTIVVVSTLDLPVLRQVKRALATLRQLGLADRLDLVLNRADADTGVALSDAVQTLGMKPLAVLPSDGLTAVRSVSDGVPFVSGKARTKLALAVRQLAERLTGA